MQNKLKRKKIFFLFLFFSRSQAPAWERENFFWVCVIGKLFLDSFGLKKLTKISGYRDAIRFAFSSNLISNGDLWMDMIKSRIKTSHTYNEETAEEIYIKILNEYHSLFLEFEQIMKNKIATEEQNLFNQ